MEPTALLAGWLAAHVVELAKSHPDIPIDASTTRRVQFFCTLVGMLLNVLVIICTHQQVTYDWATFIKLLMDTAVSFVTAEFTYHQTMKKAG